MARLTLESARTESDDPIAEPMQTLQRDELRRRATLLGHINVLGGMPSLKIDSFYEDAMAIVDLNGRITSLNRHRGRMVGKLRQILPRVRNDRLHADLTELLRSLEPDIPLVKNARGDAL